MKKNLEIRVAVSVGTGLVVSGIDYQDSYDLCASILKNSEGFDYDTTKELKVNLIAFYVKQGYPQFEVVCHMFSELMKSWIAKKMDLSFINTGVNAKIMASSQGVPEILEVEVKEPEKTAPAPQPKPATEAIAEKPQIKRINWLGSEAFCAFCGRKLAVHELDKTGYAFDATNCTCEGHLKSLTE